MKSSMPNNNNNNNNNIARSCDITNNNKRKRNVVRSCLVTKAKVLSIVSTKVLMVSILILVTTIIIPYETVAFTPTSIIPKLSKQQHSTTTQLYNSKPSRLEENVDGVVYVNDKCIDCAACKGFASQIFRSNTIDTAHIVYQQPQTLHDIVMTRAALAACPVAAIRIESYAERNRKTSIHNKNIQMNNDSTMTAGTSTVQVANDVIQDVAWSEEDSWIVQQMTSKEMKRPFPRPFLLNETIETSTINHHNDDEDDFKTVLPDVYWTGHHNERSFGAIPYLVKAYYNNTNVWIMIDVPKFNIQSVRDVTSLTGPNGPHYLFMTHVDDTADHELWANYFNSTLSGYCQRIFHSGDLGRYNWIGDTTLEHVPILLQSPSTPTNSNSLTAYTLDGTILTDDSWIEQFENGSLNTDVIILHTPGHSPGSCTLYKRRRTMKLNNDENDSKTIPGVLFTGDTYAYTGTKMSGFPRYGRDMVQQSHTLSSLVMKLQQWDIIAPGHGLPRDYRDVPNAIRITELEQAQRDLFKHRR